MRAKHVFRYLEFRSYLKTNYPNRFHFLLTVLLRSKFNAKSTYQLLKQPLRKPTPKHEDTLREASISVDWKPTMR